MQEKALEISSHITHPVTVAVFAAVLAASAFALAIRAKKPRVAWALAIGIIVLGLAPLAAFTFLQSRGIYHVRVIVLTPDQMPSDDAHVTSSSGGEAKKVEGGWEFDIPPQTRPADGTVNLYASEKSAFLKGQATVVLADDYYPAATIQLAADTSATLRGVVVDEHGRPAAGARVSISGYSDSALTDQNGNFVLPAHASDGQVVQVRAEKGPLLGTMSAPAGSSATQVVIHRP